MNLKLYIICAVVFISCNQQPSPPPPEINPEDYAKAVLQAEKERKARQGLINRNETNGKYGVWGHDLSDLDLSSIEIYLNAEGKIYIMPSIES